jgi:HK97 family phage prohead protease
MILTFSSHVEASDSERRIIAGKIVPFGEIGNTSAGPVVFEKGSIKIGDPGKIKMLMQHKSEKPIGRMQKYQEAEDGIYAQFKVSASMQGQDALILAQEQLVDGLSVGVEIIASKNEKNYIKVTSAVLKEVSLVETPAFANANVHKVAASENEAENTNQSTESEAIVEDKAPEPQSTRSKGRGCYSYSRSCSPNDFKCCLYNTTITNQFKSIIFATLNQSQVRQP